MLGCTPASKQTEYIKINVPVKYKLDRPDRPKYEREDTPPVYVLKLINYTLTLENIIDEYNKD